MEEYIADTKRICTNYFGEQGLGEKIGNNVRDGLICETAERIQDDSSTPASVCLELRGHLMYEPVCYAALKKLDTFTQGISKFPLRREVLELETEEEKQHQAVCYEIMDASNNAELILNAMENSANISSIQEYGVQILGEILSNTDYDNFHGHSPYAMQMFLHSLGTDFPDREHVQETILRVLKKLWTNSVDSRFWDSFALQNAVSSIGLCLAALRRYPTNNHVVDGAFFLLTAVQSRMHEDAFFEVFSPDVRDIAQNAIETQNNRIMIGILRLLHNANLR